MRKSLAWFRTHWRNGLRFQLAISIIILGGIIALFLQARAYFNDDPSPVTIAHVDVIEPVMLGEPFHFTTTICNRLDGSVSVSIAEAFESDPPVRTVPALGMSTRAVVPGCAAGPIRELTLPDRITPGKWTLVISVLVASPGVGGFSFVTAESEAFMVEGAR